MSTTIPMPARIARLPRDKHDRPVPWFVHRDDDGVPDFRVIGRDRMADAHRFELCWVCGQRRGRHAAFVIGPMCGVNRVSAEPPSHLDCALYSARGCPFLATPTMRRRDRDLGPLDASTAGHAIDRNPGVALVWSSRTWAPFRVPAHGPNTAGVLWNVGEPTAISWWAHGRPATRAEVLASIDSGMPLLHAAAATGGARALAMLDRQYAEALQLLPAEPSTDQPDTATSPAAAR